jgi:hypothetical protein
MIAAARLISTTLVRLTIAANIQYSTTLVRLTIAANIQYSTTDSAAHNSSQYPIFNNGSAAHNSSQMPRFNNAWCHDGVAVAGNNALYSALHEQGPRWTLKAFWKGQAVTITVTSPTGDAALVHVIFSTCTAPLTTAVSP